MDSIRRNIRDVFKRQFTVSAPHTRMDPVTLDVIQPHETTFVCVIRGAIKSSHVWNGPNFERNIADRLCTPWPVIYDLQRVGHGGNNLWSRYVKVYPYSWIAVIAVALEKLDTFISMYRKHFRLRYVVTKCMMRVYSSYSLVSVLGVCVVCNAESSAYL